MATRRLGMTCLLCVLVSLAGGCTRTRPGERIVVKDVSFAIWSKDGQSLYYEKHGIYRYDADTGQRHLYRIQKEASEGFDLSPDEQQIVFKRYGEGIYTADLKTGRVRLAYPTQESVLSLHWPSASHIVFSLRVPDGDPETYLLSSSTGSVTRFDPGSYAEFSASKGGGLIYLDEDNRCRYHNLDDGTDKSLASCPPFGGENDAEFLFLNEHKLIYNVWQSSDYQYTEIVDLKTMRTRRTVLPDVHPDMTLSPDLTKFWYTGPHHQDTEPLKLYLVDIPPQTVKQLKAPVK